jgi:predicted O-methyltransferase YrrM
MSSSLPSTTSNVAALCAAVDAGWNLVRETRGFLSEREARFLMNAVALTPAQGANVEIGSFMGRSTVGLAYVVRALGNRKLTAIDPHTAPSETDPQLDGAETSYSQFIANLDRANVRDVVDVRVAYSSEVAQNWNEPIRFLWIDGDHTYAGAKADLDMFKPFLVDGAIVAMHDVLSTFEGSLRVFVEEILRSDDFGAAGFSGSIGYAQYRPVTGRSLSHRIQRRLLAIPAGHLILVAARGRHLRGIDKYIYKFWRPLAPHGDARPAKLMRQFGL